jgi:hypothetical protein
LRGVEEILIGFDYRRGFLLADDFGGAGVPIGRTVSHTFEMVFKLK